MTCAWKHEIGKVWTCAQCGATGRSETSGPPKWCPLKTM